MAALAHLLVRRGIGPGQRIAFRCADGIDYVIGALALLENGAAVVPLADALTDRETQDTLRRIDVHGVMVQRRLSAAADLIDEVFAWEPRSAIGEKDRRCRELGAAFIRFSSGTTGESKGVVLSHQCILERTAAANRGLAVTPNDTILWMLGMSHHFVVSILLFLRSGATIVLANRPFPFAACDAAARFPITFLYGSPVHYYLLSVAAELEAASLKNVRLAVSTAMKMPPETFARFSQKFGFIPAEAYGIIEVGIPFINLDPAGQNTVGRVLPDFQVQIDHPDQDGLGEILLRGKGMFDAYFSPWRERADCLDNGWFRTGDLGRLDEAGRLCLLGRSKTVIVCAGMKVFPEEVESTINAMPGISESLVTGRAHPQFGQAPVATVVIGSDVRDTEQFLQSLRGHCCRLLSPYKVPVEFRVVDGLPKTPSGKLVRAVPCS